jgi:hypothetical protein
MNFEEVPQGAPFPGAKADAAALFGATMNAISDGPSAGCAVVHKRHWMARVRTSGRIMK